LLFVSEKHRVDDKSKKYQAEGYKYKSKDPDNIEVPALEFLFHHHFFEEIRDFQN